MKRKIEEFDYQHKDYQQMLTGACIHAELRVPFDRERPTESQAALMALVKNCLDRHFSFLYSNLKNSLQVIRYSIQVQSLELSHTEACTREALQLATRLREQIRIEEIS